MNLTDEESRIMPTPGGGFVQAYIAQAGVVTDSLLVVTRDVVQASNDKREVASCLAAIEMLPEGLGAVETLLADNGYMSEANVEACAARAIEPLIAQARERHHKPLAECFALVPDTPVDPTPLEAITHALKTPRGRKLYALRKQTVEPVFGIIKEVMASAASRYAGSKRCMANGASSPWPGTSSACSSSDQPETIPAHATPKTWRPKKTTAKTKP